MDNNFEENFTESVKTGALMTPEPKGSVKREKNLLLYIIITILSLAVLILSITLIFFISNYGNSLYGEVVTTDDETTEPKIWMVCANDSAQYDFYDNGDYGITDFSSDTYEVGTYVVKDSLISLTVDSGVQRNAVYDSDTIMDNGIDYACEEVEE